VARRLPDLGPAQLPVFDQFFEHVRSWSTTDDFCINILGPLLQRFPRATLRLLYAWTSSRVPGSAVL
jgi:hypothetical protein